MSLDRFQRIALCHRPTPLESLNRLSEHLGGPRILMKRDDCTGLAGGGNKTRKLEFLMADALEQGADTVITTGGLQSNHARQTAAAAAKIGLKCELVLPRVVDRHDPLYESNGNVLLDRLLGAIIHVVDDRDEAERRIQQLTAAVAARGGKAYFIPTGGSTPVGALGYVDAMLECLDQAEQAGVTPTHHIVVTGSGGTHSGLLVGLMLKNSPQSLCGFSVAHAASQDRSVVRSLAEKTAKLVGLSRDVDSQQIRIDDKFLGAGYGEPTKAMLEAVSLLARLEGILLDPVYTGKAMAGLIDAVRRGQFEPTDQIVFWHTGGTPALYAYQPAFDA